MKLSLLVANGILSLSILESSVVIITGFITHPQFRASLSYINKFDALAVSKYGVDSRGYLANGVPASGRNEISQMEDAIEQRLAKIEQMEKDLEQRLINLSQKERDLQQQERLGPGGPRGSSDYSIGRRLEIFGSQTPNSNSLDVGALNDDTYYSTSDYNSNRITKNKFYSPLGSTEAPSSSTYMPIGTNSDRMTEAAPVQSTTTSPQEGDYSKAILATIAVGLGSTLAFQAVNQKNPPSEQWSSLMTRTNTWLETMKPATKKVKDVEAVSLESATNTLMEKLKTGATIESGVVKTTSKDKIETAGKEEVLPRKVVEKEPIVSNSAQSTNIVEKPVGESPKLAPETISTPKSPEAVSKAEATIISKSSEAITKEESAITSEAKVAAIEETAKLLGKVEESLAAAETKVMPSSGSSLKDSGTVVTEESTKSLEPSFKGSEKVDIKETATIAEPKAITTAEATLKVSGLAVPEENVVIVEPQVVAAAEATSKGPEQIVSTKESVSIAEPKVSTTESTTSKGSFGTESSISNVMKIEGTGSKDSLINANPEDLLREAAVNTFMKALLAGDVSVESAAKVENAIEKFLKARESAGKSVTNVNSMTATIKPSGQDLETGVAVDAVVNTILEQLRAGVTLEIKAKVPDARTSS
jgi:hypothetical protein